jgi:hypothetical protein
MPKVLNCGAEVAWWTLDTDSVCIILNHPSATVKSFLRMKLNPLSFLENYINAFLNWAMIGNGW